MHAEFINGICTKGKLICFSAEVKTFSELIRYERNDPEEERWDQRTSPAGAGPRHLLFSRIKGLAQGQTRPCSCKDARD